MQKDYRRAKLLRYSSAVGAVASGGGLAVGGVMLSAPSELVIGVLMASLLGGAGIQVRLVHDFCRRGM